MLTNTKRWERGSDPEGDRAATRVVDAQRQAATTLRLTLAFLVAGAVAIALALGGLDLATRVVRLRAPEPLQP